MTKSNLTSQGSHEVKIWPLRGLNQTSEIWFWNSDYIFGFLGPKNLLLDTYNQKYVSCNRGHRRSKYDLWEFYMWLQRYGFEILITFLVSLGPKTYYKTPLTQNMTKSNFTSQRSQKVKEWPLKDKTLEI